MHRARIPRPIPVATRSLFYVPKGPAYFVIGLAVAFMALLALAAVS